MCRSSGGSVYPLQVTHARWRLVFAKSGLENINADRNPVCVCVFCTLCCPLGNFPMGNLGRFPQEKPAATVSCFPPLINYKVHAGSFRVSVIYQTLIWTTGSLMCVRACVYTQGLCTLTASQHNIFDLEKLTIFVCAPDGIRTSGLWISSPSLNQLSHPSPVCVCVFVCLSVCVPCKQFLGNSPSSSLAW